MGFFSDIASEARRGMAAQARQTAAPSATPEPKSDPPAPAPEVSAVHSAPAPTAGASSPPQTPPQVEHAPSAHTPPPPELKLNVEQVPDDTAARQAHEAAEAERKAEWDAKQAEKKAKRQAELDRIKAMNDVELLEAAVGRVAADTERLTRRNMKAALAEHISAKCREDAAFARLVLRPEKSMASCFRYVTRKAQEYAEQEMKDNGIEPDPGSEGYGCDVPDDLVYQWAVDYFNDPDAEEDREKDDEKFVPKPYVPSIRKKTQGKAAKKPTPAEKPRTEKPSDTGMEQLTLGVM